MAEENTTAAGSTLEETPRERLGLSPESSRGNTQQWLEDLKRVLLEDRGQLQGRPPVASPDGTVISGNRRLHAARELGWSTLPVLAVEVDLAAAQDWSLPSLEQGGDERDRQ